MRGKAGKCWICGNDMVRFWWVQEGKACIRCAEPRLRTSLTEHEQEAKLLRARLKKLYKIAKETA